MELILVQNGAINIHHYVVFNITQDEDVFKVTDYTDPMGGEDKVADEDNKMSNLIYENIKIINKKKPQRNIHATTRVYKNESVQILESIREAGQSELEELGRSIVEEYTLTAGATTGLYIVCSASICKKKVYERFSFIIKIDNTRAMIQGEDDISIEEYALNSKDVRAIQWPLVVDSYDCIKVTDTKKNGFISQLGDLESYVELEHIANAKDNIFVEYVNQMGHISVNAYLEKPYFERNGSRWLFDEDRDYVDMDNTEASIISSNLRGAYEESNILKDTTKLKTDGGSSVVNINSEEIGNSVRFCKHGEDKYILIKFDRCEIIGGTKVVDFIKLDDIQSVLK